VTVATALLSVLTGRSVRADLAMTGEVTLRGRVLPVGGVKEKVLAAHRAGVRRIVLPRRNEKDLEDLPTSVREELQFILVDALSEVFAACFADGTARRAA
jgi:ATP-dependent Lon protease